MIFGDLIRSGVFWFLAIRFVLVFVEGFVHVVGQVDRTASALMPISIAGETLPCSRCCPQLRLRHVRDVASVRILAVVLPRADIRILTFDLGHQVVIDFANYACQAPFTSAGTSTPAKPRLMIVRLQIQQSDYKHDKGKQTNSPGKHL